MKRQPASRVALALSLTCLPLVAEAQAPRVDPALAKSAKDFVAVMNTKDAAKLAAFYTEDAAFNPPNEPAVRGRSAIQAWIQKMFDQGTVTLTLTPIESAISGNIGYQAQSYVFTMKPTGAAPMTDKGKSLVVFNHVGGKWLVAHDIFNSDLPPPAAPAPAKPPAKPAM